MNDQRAQVRSLWRLSSSCAVYVLISDPSERGLPRITPCVSDECGVSHDHFRNSDVGAFTGRRSSDAKGHVDSFVVKSEY